MTMIGRRVVASGLSSINTLSPGIIDQFIQYLRR